jgi:glutamate-1-semialdehyde 2,1-aminomutase
MSATLTATRSALERFEAEFPTSRRLYEEARDVFPAGVTHDSRFLEPFPVYVDHARGSRKWDVDGHEIIDYWAGHGALLLGHSHPALVEAVQKQIARGTHPGACHELEIEWGRWVKKLIPSAERVRFTSSGTEATLMALRLARIHTGKPRVLKFAGHFHGWNDFVVPASGAPSELEPVPGVLDEIHTSTVVIPPNDLDRVDDALARDPQIGCVILEPTGGHWGSVPVRGEFLRGLREITRRRERLLIFDEVITGFRVAPGGAQAHYNVTPDLTTLAKIVAGGLPGGCVVGRADVMAGLEFRPGKPKMRHPGTFNANPLSAAAGIAVLQLVATGEPCRHANAIAALLRRRLNTLFAEREAPFVCYGEFSGFRLLPGYRGPRPASDDFVPYDGDPDQLDSPALNRQIGALRRAMLLGGVDLFGLGGMTTLAHTEADVEQTVGAMGQALELLER